MRIEILTCTYTLIGNSWSTLPRGIKHLKVIKLWGRTFVRKCYNEKEAMRSRCFWLMQVLAITPEWCICDRFCLRNVCLKNNYTRLCLSLFQNTVWWKIYSTKLAFVSLLPYSRSRRRRPLNMASAAEFSANWSPAQKTCTRWCWKTLLAIGIHASIKLMIATSGILWSWTF